MFGMFKAHQLLLGAVLGAIGYEVVYRRKSNGRGPS